MDFSNQLFLFLSLSLNTVFYSPSCLSRSLCFYSSLSKLSQAENPTYLRRRSHPRALPTRVLIPPPPPPLLSATDVAAAPGSFATTSAAASSLTFSCKGWIRPVTRIRCLSSLASSANSENEAAGILHPQLAPPAVPGKFILALLPSRRASCIWKMARRATDPAEALTNAPAGSLAAPSPRYASRFLLSLAFAEPSSHQPRQVSLSCVPGYATVSTVWL